MNIIFDNGDVNGDYFNMNSSTGYVINTHNYIDYTNRRDEISLNIYFREYYGLLDGVDLDNMLPASPPHQYVNMEYNNEHHNS